MSSRSLIAGISRSLSPLWTQEMRRIGVELGRGVVALGRPIVSRIDSSTVSIGDRSVLVSVSHSTALGVPHPVILRTLLESAEIRIGHDCGLSGVALCATTSVSVGDRCLLGSGVLIADTDFHPTDVLPRRYAPIPRPAASHAVIIDDDVFIGARSVVLKGVRIGARSVIGAGSVVTESIPADAVAVGVPARVVKHL